MAVPVTLYMAVLAAMVCAAFLARLPTPWTALGALCFAVSDGMIGIGRFVLETGAGLPATFDRASGTLFNADLQRTSWKVMPSNCGVRTLRTNPMR